jgi:Uma2 family endonuclease
MTVLDRPGTVAPPQQAAVPNHPIWRMSVEHYHAMIQAGILTEDEPVELLEGWLIQKIAKNPSHRAVTGLIREALERLLCDGWYVDSHEPVTTLDSEPEPDITVVRGTILDYMQRHPHPHELALVVEVAEATLRRDRGIKKRLYARAGIPVYWLVNLVNQTVVVYTEPDSTGSPPDYRRHKIYRRSEQIPVVVDGTLVGELAVDEILPELPG